MEMRRFSKIFKALSDETRLRILQFIAQEEKCVGAVAERFGIAPSVASHHLKILENAGFVRRRKVQRWVRYQLDLEALQRLVAEFFDYLGLEVEEGPTEVTELLQQHDQAR